MTNLPKFIAEVSSNHKQNLERCLRFVEVAAEIGCDAIKFQLFKTSELFAPEILNKSKEHRERKDWELPLSFIPKISSHAHKLGIEFGCTPFYLSGVKELEPFVDFYKIASYELLWLDLIKECAKIGKPLIISTGMANEAEIIQAVDTVKKLKNLDVSLMHCVSGYPVPLNDCNLSAIETIRQLTGCNVGWSDHSASPAIIYRAIHAWNASDIEFHLDLDGRGDEFAPGHCWLPENIQPIISNVRASFVADGNGRKEPAPSELADRQWRADPTDGLRPLKKVRNDWKDQKT